MEASTSTKRQQEFERAQSALLTEYGVSFDERRIRLADPTLSVHVLECGAGDPTVFIHGSGMSAATWAPLLAELPTRRALCVDLPGFGLSDPCDYRGRTLPAHAVAQMTSILDALGLGRAPIVGTSLGAMWALCLAAHAPERVTSVLGLGVPAVSVPGVRADAFFRVVTTPVLGRVVTRIAAPPNVAATRRAMAKVLGPAALARTPDSFFVLVRAGMRMPAWSQAMWTHLNLAFDAGRQRTENILSDVELKRITATVLLIWGDNDVYGGPELGQPAMRVIANGRLEVMPGGHAPFLDDPQRCAALIAEAV